ncbi:MAG: N-acetylneuraminate synthase [Bdellovibrionia bacterium]
MMKSSNLKRTFVIAEAGVNHNGDMGLARQLVDEAKRAGADAVKFQLFRSEDLVVKNAPKAAYQERDQSTGQFEMLKRLELSFEKQMELSRYSTKIGITFMTSAFDASSLRLLPELGVTRIKIPSGEITNLPYLCEAARLPHEQIILSTGASDLEEVANAVDLLVSSGVKREKLVLLHCNTEYPSPLQDVNLLAMTTMAREFSVAVGYSDHTLSLTLPAVATALGASCIEKHFTLDKSMPGPDHAASLTPDELASMIKAVRETEVILGHAKKQPSPSEMKNRDIVRKSLVAKSKIRRGESFSDENVTAKRPGTGMSPMTWKDLLGKTATRDYDVDDFIQEES